MSEPNKYEFNTKDIIANLRFADPIMVKIVDFFMSVPFLSHPMLLKILTVLLVLGLPLMALVGLFGAIGGIVAAIISFNIIGIITTVISLGYLFWIAGSTIFSKESDLKLADLGTWSKIFVVAIFINLVVSCILNIWVRGVGGLITELIMDFISITLSMYLVPFFARYFDGVVLDGLAPHPDAKVPNPHA